MTPVKKEAEYLGSTSSRYQSDNRSPSLVAVDDGSTDDTAETVEWAIADIDWEFLAQPTTISYSKITTSRAYSTIRNLPPRRVYDVDPGRRSARARVGRRLTGDPPC